MNVRSTTKIPQINLIGQNTMISKIKSTLKIQEQMFCSFVQMLVIISSTKIHHLNISRGTSFQISTIGACLMKF